MPKIKSDEDMQIHQLAGGNFSFTALRLDRLGSTEYTLATIAIDITGSVQGFEAGLLLALVTAIKSCKKCARSENLLVRVITFNSRGIVELHGFKPLSDIDPDNDYAPFNAYGATPLYDATYSSVASMVDYGKMLMDSDFLCNGIAFIITDGEDNTSTRTPKMIKDQIQAVKRGEKMESLITVLIGINTLGCAPALDQFRAEAELDQFIDVGDVTPGKLAKLAQFVSQSVSSQSQAIGTGGPSQSIAPTI